MPSKKNPYWRGTCSIDGCDKEVRGRGWCGTHYSRWQATGDPLWTKRYVGITDIERILSLTAEQVNGCHEWQGTRTRNGYGFIYRRRREVSVHRVAYEALIGPIPKGWHVHHRCKNRVCVNPEHLEVLPASKHISQHRAEQTCCKRGHEFTEENTVWEWRNYKGERKLKRLCRICLRERQRRSDARRRKVAA